MALQFSTFGCHGSEAYMEFKHFPRLDTAADWLRSEGVALVGVEICEGAHPLPAAPFTGPTAFLLGNEGHGLTDEELVICDWCVYIPQHGSGTASLNVANACAVVLYGFATWAKYTEAPREGYKYTLAPRPQRNTTKGRVPDCTPEERAARRAAAREAATSDDVGLGELTLFDDVGGAEE